MDFNKSGLFENFSGIVLINKKPQMTSFDVIRRFKKVFFLIKSAIAVPWISLQKEYL